MSPTKKRATKKRATKRRAKRPPRRSTASAAAADQVREVLRSKRFLAADRADLEVSEIATWDPYLLREHRLLVPIDVQALYVENGSTEKMVPLPMLVAGADGHGVADPEDGLPDPFTEGAPRPPGVHLHWAMPDALLRGTLEQRTDGAPNRLGLPVLPDRWTLLRILLPRGGSDVVVTGWVLEADRAIAVPLGSWKEGGAIPAGVKPLGETIDKASLTGTIGGSVSWSAVYDAVINRFAFHDPLDDLATLAPNGVDRECGAYLVTGWWSEAARDPLDAARSSDSLHELLDRLRWRLMYEWGSEQGSVAEQKAEFDLRRALGLTTSDRWSSPRSTGSDVHQGPPVPAAKKAAAAAAAAAGPIQSAPIVAATLEKQAVVGTSAFSDEAVERYVMPAWHLRSTLLHGSIYGVPVAGGALVDRRPAAAELAVALGRHDDDLLAALASPPDATLDDRRDAERLLAAFTAQKIDRLASADGIAELEDFEHSAEFASLPGGKAGTDRFVQRVQTGGVGGLDVGKTSAANASSAATAFAPPAPHPQAPRGPAAAARAAARQSDATVFFSAKGKPTLAIATEAMVNDAARSRVGDVLAPTDARVVNRPAVKFRFPGEPMVIVRGAARSLRHGGDGRGSADGKLTCRWPTQVVSQISGILPPDRFIRSLGSGGIPEEVLALARETVLYDPYHNEWLAAAVTEPGGDSAGILGRLQAETVMRFGHDGTYDGATAAFHPTLAKAPQARRVQAAAAPLTIEPGVRQQQMLIADEIAKFSLYAGVDPDLVGVTTWAQPWVPMWLEWEVKVEGIDPPTLDAWRLGQIDLEQPVAKIEGDSAVLRGRAHLTTGAASTLHDAIADWLKAEDALDAAGAGLVDEATEQSLATLDEGVGRLDVVTAALDGVRTQLLGLPVSDGLRRPVDGTSVKNPAPIAPPHALVAGSLTLTRARLLDTFGRTLEVPLANVAIPSRSTLPDRPGVLAQPPRLLRPARWLFRLVDAATPAGAEGREARVDQIEPSLQVNPVVGFVMPDHLDESLEVFDVAGAPIGELLHEPVSGGVMWEIAPGREGPADAGPGFGLTAAQAALGRFAAGLVAADAAARRGAPLDPDASSESALSSMLRAIDTTLWTVDAFAAFGSEHVAGLVGRPVAVVRAQLRLELRAPDDVDLSDPERAAKWAAAEEAAARYAFPVRVGELTRTDDGVLGFFVDDDFSRFRLVDKAIAGSAPDAGRSRGQLGLYGKVNGMPAHAAIDHPYIAGTDDADTLLLHIGQTVTLTIFMHPAGKAFLTSGVLPRDSVALARDWVGPGLAAIAPSLRTGPVLVETDLDTNRQVRLPKVSVFGTNQNFLWRDTPATWRSDAILAATQTALLPDAPAELREGWIRVAPENPDDGTGTPPASGGAS